MAIGIPKRRSRRAARDGFGPAMAARSTSRAAAPAPGNRNPPGRVTPPVPVGVEVAVFKLCPLSGGRRPWLAGAPSAVAGAPPPALDWQPCEPAGFECATAEVPRDHARPQGPKLELAMIRWPASDRENRIGSLFLNSGGPGRCGSDMVREAPRPLWRGLGRLYGIVGVDPRGVGARRPACRTRRPLSGRPVPAAGDAGPRRRRPHRPRPAAPLRGGERRRSCPTSRRPTSPATSTCSTPAVGDAKFNYFGISYGGLIGKTYTSLFPGPKRRDGA